MLNLMNVPNREGTPWRISTVEYILGNERYIGDAISQKTYTDAAVPFKNRPNRGKVPQYYVENTNPPIISKEDYEAAKNLTKERKSRRPYKKSTEITLNGKIHCSCGGNYYKKIVSGKTYWTCGRHELDSGNRLIAEPSLIVTKETGVYCESPDIRCKTGEIERMTAALDVEAETVQKLIFECAEEKYREIKSERHITDRMKAELINTAPLSCFSEELFEKTITAITMERDGNIQLILKNGFVAEKEKL